MNICPFCLNKGWYAEHGTGKRVPCDCASERDIYLRQEAARNLSFLISVIRNGKGLSADEERAVRLLIAELIGTEREKVGKGSS
jgi:hypothetical protein